MKKSKDIMKKFESDLRKEKLKIKVKRLKDFKTTYACRGCLALTNKTYKVKRTNVIACCADCARDAIECASDKRPWIIPPKIQKKMKKEQLEGYVRFWFPLEKRIFPNMISKDIMKVKPK